MTREELNKICHRHCVVTPFHTLVDDILAALEREREGEVELDSGSVYGMAWHIVDNFEKDKFYDQFREKRGQLIFRPTKAKEAGL